MIRRPPSSPLFPSPPLFRSDRRGARRAQSGRHHAPLPSRRQPVSDPPGVQVPLPDLTEETATEPLLRVAGRQLPPSARGIPLCLPASPSESHERQRRAASAEPSNGPTHQTH